MTIRISVRRLRARDGGAPPRSEAAERVYDTIKKPLDGEISTEDFLRPAVSENFGAGRTFFACTAAECGIL